MLSITQFPRRFPTIRKRALQPLMLSNTSVPCAENGLTTTSLTSFQGTLMRPSTSTKLMESSHSSFSSNFSFRMLQTNASATTTTTSNMMKTSTQSFATTATAIEEDDDSYLYGERDDEWFTTSRDPRKDSTFPGVDPETGRLRSIAMPNLHTCTREEMLDYFDNTWGLTDMLFSTLQGEHAFMTPPPHQLRHPLIFYYGHPTVFYVNKFVVSGLLSEPVNPYFEHIFEVGVDEMRWDDMSKNEMDWPSVVEATEYRRQVYKIIRDVIASHPGLNENHAPIDENSPLWALCMALEHERIHLETSSMLMLEHPVEFFRPTQHLVDYHPSAYRTNTAKHPVAGVDYPVNNLVALEGGRVTIGKPRDFPTFGWDNEYGQKEIDVPSCQVAEFQVSNGEFWEFVSSGGYLERSYWSQLGWEWRCFRNTKWPQFWVPDGPSGSHQYRLRALFNVLPMQWDWPAQVNYHEAQAFCQWKRAKDETASNLVYHLTTEPIHQLMRNPSDRSSSTTSDDVLEVRSNMAKEHQKNLNLSYASFSPVNAFEPTSNGFYDVFGNAWEWCEDMFNALPGFKLHKYYDDFSAPCFDGEHHVIMGGSYISSGDNGASKYARYHFRPHFFQHASFRVVAQTVDEDTQSYPLVTTCVNAPGPYVNSNPYRTSEMVSLKPMTSADGKNGPPSFDMDQVYRELSEKSVIAMQTFAESATATIISNGIEGVKQEKDQVVSGDSMIVLTDPSLTPLVVEELNDTYSMIKTGMVPIVHQLSPTEVRIVMQQALVWKKL